MSQPIIEFDAHGLTVDQAIRQIEALIAKCDSGTYRIRVIHGYHRGNNIQRALYDEIDRGRNPKVVRVIGGSNPGITELVLREY